MFLVQTGITFYWFYTNINYLSILKLMVTEINLIFYNKYTICFTNFIILSGKTEIIVTGITGINIYKHYHS